MNCRASSYQERTLRAAAVLCPSPWREEFSQSLSLSGESLDCLLSLGWFYGLLLYLHFAFQFAFYLGNLCKGDLLFGARQTPKYTANPSSDLGGTAVHVSLLAVTGRLERSSVGKGKLCRFLQVNSISKNELQCLMAQNQVCFQQWATELLMESLHFACGWANQDSALHGCSMLLVWFNLLDGSGTTEIKSQDFGAVWKRWFRQTTVQRVAHLHQWSEKSPSMATLSLKHHIWFEVLLLSAGLPGSV